MVSPSGLKDEKYWRAGTITEVHNFTPKKAYSVAPDPQSKTDHPSIVLVNEDWVKPLTEEEKVKIKEKIVVKENVAPANNAQSKNTTDQKKKNDKVACPLSDPDSKGATALEREIRGSIRKGFEREPELNADGRVTVTFQNVTVGPSHSWREYVDPEAARGKEIYQVRATFTTCTDYNTRIVTLKRERNFKCYKNAAGEWECDVFAGVNTNVKDESKSIEKQKN